VAGGIDVVGMGVIDVVGMGVIDVVGHRGTGVIAITVAEAVGPGAAGCHGLPVHPGRSARRPGGLLVHGRPQLRQLLGHPGGGRSARALPGGERARHRQHLAYVRC